MKKFFKTFVIGSVVAAGSGVWDAFTSGVVDKKSLITAGVAAVVGLWVTKPGDEGVAEKE
jgi:hypothetical protein